MEFILDDVEELRGVKVEQRNAESLTLSAGRLGTHAGYVYLTRREALALAGAIRAIALSLDRESPTEE